MIRALLFLLVLSFASASTGQQKAPDASVLNKCVQCHSPAMWIDQRQDRRAWESTIYRMIGRGALWTPEEIKAMADYFGKVYTKDAK